MTVRDAAFHRKEAIDRELAELEKTREQLVAQIATLDAASANVETVRAMRKGKEAMRAVQRDLYVLLLCFSGYLVAHADDKTE